MTVFLETTSFFATLSLAFFVPGFLVWRAVFGHSFSRLEEFVFAFITSIGLIDLLMLLAGRIGLPLSALPIGGALFFIAVLAGAVAWKRGALFTGTSAETFSKRGAIIAFVLLVLTLFIRTVYLAPNILPTATDLGHHMYWSAIIAETGQLPNYEKIEVVTDPATGQSHIAAPKPIADFIIGEHLPFALFAELSGLRFTSAFPILFLHFINLLSVLIVTILAYRLAQPFKEKIQPEHVALFALLLLGPLFALASPQAKFVTGGVVGNLFGNLFIPAVLLLLYRALAEKKAVYLAAATVAAFILAYTHHLSTLVLVFILIGTATAAITSLLRSGDNKFYRDWFRLARSPAVLGTLAMLFVFMALVALPTYLDIKAIDSAIGTPTKATRTGLSFFQVSNSLGMGKVAIGIVGLALAAFLALRRPLAGSFLFAWGSILLIMALFPHWLFLDIPSGRIGSYLAYPLALAGAFALAFFARLLFTESRLPRTLTFIITAAFGAFLIGTGSSDNASSLSNKDRSYELVQTFAATEYLAVHSNGEPILKDHNYLSADAWMKLFFKRDYGYPLSRGLFGRYEEGGNRRERCTLAMISTPNTDFGEQCFTDTGVRYLVVNPVYDSAQFEKSDSFSKLYTSDTAAIYERNSSRN